MTSAVAKALYTDVMIWFLYLLECRDGSIYTGIAVDVAARYAAHEKGKGARYTRSHPPRRLLAIVAYTDRSTASKAEYAMKRLSATEKRAFCLQRNVLWTLHMTGAGLDSASRGHPSERIRK